MVSRPRARTVVRSRSAGWLVHSGFQRSGPLLPFCLYTYGRIEVQFKALSGRPPFDSVDLRESLRVRLNEIGDGVALPADGLNRRPSFPLSVLQDPSKLDAFLQVMDWVFAEVRSAYGSKS